MNFADEDVAFLSPNIKYVKETLNVSFFMIKCI